MKTRLLALCMVAAGLTLAGCGDTQQQVMSSNGELGESMDQNLVPAPAAKLTSSAAPWTASGPGTVTVISDGTTADPAMSYLLTGSGAWSKKTWRFSSIAAQSGPVELEYEYTGFHAWYQVRVFLQAFVSGPDGTTVTPIINEGPVDCCASPSGGFTYTGSVVLNVAAGDEYGFKLGGSNFNSNPRLRGTLTVHIVDTTPPVVSLSVDPASLWPPNHTMQVVASGVSASDEGGLASFDVSVTSNEPVDGTGDGDTAPDWEVVDNGDGTCDVSVRAERAGNGGDRIYTITATAADLAGNTTSVSGEVTVAHDRGKGKK